MFNLKKKTMFGLDDIMKYVDTDQISNLAKKVGLKDDQVNEITSQAADAVKYRINKESARGNSSKVENLLSDKDNTDDEVKLASKMENDFVYNLTNKMGLPDSVANQLKGSVVSNMLSGVTKKLNVSNINNLDGIMNQFGDSDMLDGFKKKFSNLF